MMWFTRVTSQASVANGLSLALAFYWPALAMGIPRMSLIAALTLALTWINVRGIKQSSWVVNALTISKLAPLVIVIIFGVWFVDPVRFAAMPSVTQQQLSSALILLIFAYGGYEVTGVLAGEAANPRRDVPFAFVATLITVSIVMSLTSLVVTGVLPELASSRTAGRQRGNLPGRGRCADGRGRIGALNDRQQHGPDPERVAHHFRAG